VTVQDPVDQHLAELARALHGPARVRRSMLREARDGLHDAVAAHRTYGLAPREAAVRAVRDFGAVREIAPLYQHELVARQSRWAALLLLVAFPGMTFGWDLLWRNGVGWDTSPPPTLVVALARLQDTASFLVAAVAVVLLAVTFLRAAPTRQVAVLAGLTGVTGAVVCGGTGVLMNLVNGPATAAMLVTKPFALPAFMVSALVCALVVRSAVRTLRVAATRVAD
jgi:hypothetical protein